MRLALLIEQFDAEGGGAERSLGQIAGHLLERGHQVTILAGIYHRRTVLQDIEVQSLFQGHRHSALAAWMLAAWAGRRLAAADFDASLSVTTGMSAAVVQPRGGTVLETLERNVAMRRTSRARMTKRLFIQLSAKQQMLLRLERRVMRDPSVRRFVAVSRYVQRQLHEHYRIDPARIELIPNAADMPEPAQRQRADWRRQVRRDFSVGRKAPVFLFAAHNPRLKGIEPLLHAVGLLRRRGEDATLIIAGRQDYALVRMVAEQGIRDCVRFVGATNQMARLYAASDVTVLPTFYDPSSKVVIESLMMGVPAITTSFNGAADFLAGPGHAPRGVVIEDPADVEALARAMSSLIDPAQRRRCAAATVGLRDALSMSRHVDLLEAVLADVAAGR